MHASGQPFSRTANDPGAPAPGLTYFYLTRAQSGCAFPLNLGSLGANSAGVPRTGRDCP